MGHYAGEMHDELLTLFTPITPNRSNTMAKFFTMMQRIDTPSGSVYAHQGDDQGYSSNAKLTTAKRAVEDENESTLTNWSYTLQDSDTLPAAGSKVYVVFQKVMVGDSRVLLNPDGEVGLAWVDKKGAQAHYKELGGSDAGYRLFSFTIDQPSAPAQRDFAVTITVRAASQEEANRIALGYTNGHAPHAVPAR